jgi:UPF0716 protein FxsA
MVLLVLLFIAVPILELLVIIEVARGIGVGPTLGLLLVSAIAGAILLRTQGRAAWSRFNLALAEGRIPARETADGAMILFGGALLLTPGFITDVTGLALLAPPTRALVRRGLGGMARRRMAFTWRMVRPGSWRSPGDAGAGPRPDRDAGAGPRPDRDAGAGPRSYGAPGAGPPPRSYDYEGEAREVVDDRELPGEGRDG